jgi:hypothetical protein
MDESDLLLHFRLILREEIAIFAAQMDRASISSSIHSKV